LIEIFIAIKLYISLSNKYC